MNNLKKLFSVLLLGSAVPAFAGNPFVIPWTCADRPICTDILGSYHEANAKVGEVLFDAQDQFSQSTCCQLGGKIWKEVCAVKKDPKGVEVSCK